MNTIKKNCENCLELEYIEGEDFDQNGYVCNKKNYRSLHKEYEHLRKLTQREYRLKPKRCCVLRGCIINVCNIGEGHDNG